MEKEEGDGLHISSYISCRAHTSAAVTISSITNDDTKCLGPMASPTGGGVNWGSIQHADNIEGSRECKSGRGSSSSHRGQSAPICRRKIHKTKWAENDNVSTNKLTFTID